MSLCGVGIDVADVGRFARMDRRYGERFRRRWFTDHELAQCDATSDRPSCLAARFAAKEAVWKGLGLGFDEPLSWRQMAVLGLDRTGRYRVELTGAVLARAARIGAGAIRVSVTRSNSLVVAVALIEQAEARGLERPVRLRFNGHTA